MLMVLLFSYFYQLLGVLCGAKTAAGHLGPENQVKTKQVYNDRKQRL